jgi:hypothetical protein
MADYASLIRPSTRGSGVIHAVLSIAYALVVHRFVHTQVFVAGLFPCFAQLVQGFAPAYTQPYPHKKVILCYPYDFPQAYPQRHHHHG